MKLTKKVIGKIKDDSQIIAKLCAAADKSYPTIKRYIKANSEQLTTAACLAVICEELKMTQDDVLQKNKVAHWVYKKY